MAAHFFRLNNRSYSYSHVVGRMEYSGTGFRHPVDMALSKDGLIYVISRAHEETVAGLGGVRVTVVTPDEELVGEFGHYGIEPGEFRWPTSIALDSDTNVYVCDEWLRRVCIYDKDGKFLSQWEVPGPKEDEPSYPTGMAFDREDNLYLVDRGNHYVQTYTKEGKLLHQFGTHGAAPGQLDMPWGITVDDQKNVWIVDWRNDRFQKFTADGKFVASAGSSGDLPGQFNRPTNIAVDRDGDVYVTDWLNHRVQVFTHELRHLTTLMGDATFSNWGWDKIKSNPSMLQMLGQMRDLTSIQRFWFPVAVEVDQSGRVMVLETGRHRIQIYQKQMAGALA